MTLKRHAKRRGRIERAVIEILSRLLSRMVLWNDLHCCHLARKQMILWERLRLICNRARVSVWGNESERGSMFGDLCSPCLLNV
jgi:hypothetical protein